LLLLLLLPVSNALQQLQLTEVLLLKLLLPL
jgi:hypothetical protein